MTAAALLYQSSAGTWRRQHLLKKRVHARSESSTLQYRTSAACRVVCQLKAKKDLSHGPLRVFGNQAGVGRSSCAEVPKQASHARGKNRWTNQKKQRFSPLEPCITETAGGSLTGQFQITSVMSAGQSSQGRLRLDSHNLSFTGVRSGQSVSLTFSEFFFAKTLTGAADLARMRLCA